MEKEQTNVIAHILVSFEIVNSYLTSLIGDLLQDADIGNKLFKNTNTPFGYITKYFKIIYEHKIKDLDKLKNYSDLHKRLKECAKYRNEVAHSGMLITLDTETEGISDKQFTNLKDGKAWTNSVLLDYCSYILDTAKLILDLKSDLELIKFK